MAVEHVLLGLLRHDARHGYDLAREFAPGEVLGDIVHLEMGMLYTHLKKLERDGLVEAAVETQGVRPPRKVFRLTVAGEQALRDWLRDPVEHTRDLRLEFLLKLYVARNEDPALVDELMSKQLDVCRGFVASLSEQLAAETDDFHRLVLEMRLAQNQALLSWLARASAQTPV